MKLPEFQQRFRNWMKNPEAIALPPGYFKDGLQRLSLDEKIQIYVNDYHFRLVEALGDSFGNIRRVLSDEEFFALVRRYTAKHPSHSHDLGCFGENMAEFLAHDELSQERPYLSDLALAEWSLTQVFHSEWRQPVRVEVFSARDEVAWPATRVIFQPSLKLLPSPWPLAKLLHLKSMSDDELQAFELNRGEASFLRIVQMADGRIDWLSLSLAEGNFLQALMAGKTVGQACEVLDNETDAANLGAWFAAWMSHGLITQFG